MAVPRSVRALAVFVVLLVAGGGIIAAAASQAGKAPAAGPALPAIRMGDQAIYGLNYVSLDPVAPDGANATDAGTQGAPEDQAYFHFAWSDATNFTDASGRTQAADRVQASLFVADAPDAEHTVLSNTTLYLQAGTGQVLAASSPYGFPDTSSSYPSPLPLVSTRTSTHTDLRFMVYGRGQTSCLLANPWAGLVLPDGPVTVTQPCQEDWVQLRQGDRLIPLGDEVVGGIPARHYEKEGNATQELWFASGIPFPVQVRSISPAIDVDLMEGSIHIPRTIVTETMQSYAPGNEVRQPAKEPGPAAPIAMKPRQVWGMDDADTDVPFPLSKAWTVAKGLGYTPLDDYLQQHPQAYVAQSAYWESTQQSMVVRQWDVVLSDGGSAFPLAVNETEMALPIALPDALHEATLRHEASQDTGHFRFPIAPYPAPTALPSELPTAGSMLGRWSTQLGPAAHAPTGWGHAYTCHDKDCSTATTFLTVSNDASLWAYEPQVQPAPALVLAMNTTMEQMWFDAAGNAIFYLGFEFGYTGNTHVDGAAATGMRSTSKATVSLSLPEATAVRPFPVVAASTGTGLVALFGALLYWAWPSLKAFPLALWTRTRGARLAEHPARQLILEAVRAEPGIHFSALLRRTNLPNGSLVHHVRKLERSGHLSTKSVGGYTCHFLGAAPLGQAEAASATKAPGARSLLAVIQATPGMTSQQAAAAAGLQGSTVSYHVQRLVEAGLVTAVRDGRAVRLHARPTSAA